MSDQRIQLTLAEAMALLALARRGRPRTAADLDLVAALSAALTTASTKETHR